MILNPIYQNHSGFEEFIRQQKAKQFQWPFQQSQEAVQPIEEKPAEPEGGLGGGLPPPPAPPTGDMPPPKPASSGNLKNVASRMLAEGLDLPENVVNKPMSSGKDALSKNVGSNQSKLLAKRKIDETNKPSSLGGMKV